MFFQNFRRLLKLHPPPKWSAWLHDNAGSYVELKFCKADVHSYTCSGPCGAPPLRAPPALVHHWRSGRPPIPLSVSRKAPNPMIKPTALLYMYQIGFNSRDPGSIWTRDISRDFLKNPGISRFHYKVFSMCILLIPTANTLV